MAQQQGIADNVFGPNLKCPGLRHDMHGADIRKLLLIAPAAASPCG